MYLFIIAVVVVVIDQVTKRMVMNGMTVGQSIPVIDNFFYITSHRNAGAAWGILQGQMTFFYIITVVSVIGMLWYIKQQGTSDKLFGVGMGLMLGGAIGNFIDRVRYQEVVDFLDTIIFGYDFPIFNVADMGLVIGVGLLCIHTILESKRETRKEREKN